MIRRILIFPKGNKEVEHLAVYLDVAEASSLPSGWSRYANFSFTLVNQLDTKKSTRKGILIQIYVRISGDGLSLIYWNIPLSDDVRLSHNVYIVFKLNIYIDHEHQQIWVCVQNMWQITAIHSRSNAANVTTSTVKTCPQRSSLEYILWKICYRSQNATNMATKVCLPGHTIC